MATATGVGGPIIRVSSEYRGQSVRERAVQQRETTGWPSERVERAHSGEAKAPAVH